MSLEDAIEKEKRDNNNRFETPFLTRELREIENTKNHKDLSNSAKKVLDKLKKKYSIKEANDTASEIEDEIVTMGEPTDVEGDGEKLVTDEQPIDTEVKGAASKSGEGGDPEIKTGGDGSETAAGIAGDTMAMGKPKSVKGEGEELVTDEQPIDKDVKGEAPKAGEGGEAEMKPISGDDSEEIEKEIVDMGEPESIEKEAGKLVGERFIMSFDRFIAESRKNN